MTSSTKLQNFTDVRLELDPDKILFCPDHRGVIRHEQWRDIPGWEKFYQASSFGRIKSLKRFTKRGNHYIQTDKKILSLFPHNKKYLGVSLKKGNTKKSPQVHQLVAICFLKHKPNGFDLVVDHKDNIGTNNFVWNLQIVTNRFNVSKDIRKGTSKYIGVSWHTKRKRWRSAIYHNGKETHLGFFTNEKEASKYYQNALKAIKEGKPIEVKRRTPLSPEPGITLQKAHGTHPERWRARATISPGKRKLIGSFKTEQEAIEAKREFLEKNPDYRQIK